MADNVNPSAEHQAFQPFPKLDAPLVDPVTGLVTPPWYFLLVRLWQLSGSGLNTTPQGGVLQQTIQGVVANDATTGAPIGEIPSSIAEVVFETLQQAVPPDPQAENFAPGVPPDPAPDPWLVPVGAPPDPFPDLLGPVLVASLDSIALGSP